MNVDPRGQDERLSPTPDRSAQEAALAETETLIWGLLDDQLSEADACRLESMLLADEAARGRYVQCVQLHCDLADHFQPEADRLAKSPILANLEMDIIPGAEGLPKISE